jgi:hypothetical protein
VDVHVLRNSLLDMSEADVGSQSADTIKLNFNPCVLRGTRAGIKGIGLIVKSFQLGEVAARAHISA